MVRIEMENGGIIEIELYEDKAPITVNNFKNLVKRGFYDGLIFHRVIAGFMIQGGDPTGTGMGGSGEHIKGEFALNGVPNDISHERGVISMARSMMPNSAGSQKSRYSRFSPTILPLRTDSTSLNSCRRFAGRSAWVKSFLPDLP